VEFGKMGKRKLPSDQKQKTIKTSLAPNVWQAAKDSGNKSEWVRGACIRRVKREKKRRQSQSENG